ncbi:MAG: pyridoxal-phosphate dependent enzyme [Granulosicoccus sp.]|nr:pyridoxal-phosphate dependent enzyme [Granulosicoccus sp.]
MNAPIHNQAEVSQFGSGDQSLIQEIVERCQAEPLHDNVLTTIGNTPVVRIGKLAPAHVELYAKLEAFNPLGSVKDRLALGIIEAAEQSGALKPGQTVVEATSGNTGIGLAMVCAQKGYPLVVTMAENFSVERRRLMRYLGARVVLTPASRMGTGMLAKARELAQAHGWFLCEQFCNEANANMHSMTTAEEILGSFPNGSLDYFVSGFGTGGTLKGIARVLKERSPLTRIVAAEPDNSPVLRSGVPQKFTDAGEPAHQHSEFRPHLMQGWAPDFISKLTHDAQHDGLIDEIMPVSGSAALSNARELARKEGIFCGTSSGATLAAALSVAETAPAGSRLLCILPDTGERYLSTPLFDDVAVEMNEEELALSQSTSGYRFDAPKAKPETKQQAKQKTKPARSVLPAASAAAREYVESIISSTEQPLVMFSLEWCEFCWSVRKLFKLLDIDYRTIDLDSVAYQRDGWGNDVRMALAEMTGKTTIPQLYLAGQHLGGCTETFGAYHSGELAKKLAAAGVTFSAISEIDTESLLPGWLHPR